MGIGAEVSQYGRRGIKRLEYKILGLRDLHTHHRLRPMIEHLPGLLPSGPVTVAEFGSGDGINLFELVKLRPDLNAIGYELDQPSIERARGIQREFFPGANITFEGADVTSLSQVEGRYDCVLLMDIVEHIDDDAAFAAWVARTLKPGGLLAVSVPTHRYSRVFGEDFHRLVGHVRPGYTLPELTRLFPGLEVVEHWFSTGRLARIGCGFFYKYARKCPVGFVRSISMNASSLLFRWLDPSNGPEESCSLFVIFRRPA